MHPVLIARKVEIMRSSILFSDEDLYRGAEELSASQDNGAGTLPPCQSIIAFLFFLPGLSFRGHREQMFQSMEFNYTKHNVCSAYQIQTPTFFFQCLLWRTGAVWPLPWIFCLTARESGEETPLKVPSSGRSVHPQLLGDAFHFKSGPLSWRMSK